MTSKPRILLYSHDTYGLGHLRRSLSVAQQLAADIPGVHQLLLTGSMVAGAFGLPPRLDMVKLPALSKRSSGEYRARTLPLTLKQTLAWREQIIQQAVVNFRPHVVLVDKVAAGVHGELLPTLRHLKTWSPQTQIVLGMRDIEDSPDVTRREWQARGVPQLLDEVYDCLLLYGRPDIFDPVEAYGMSPQAAAKLVACGYLRRAADVRPADAVRRELGIGDKPLVVVTVGGGGDGYDILQTAVEMLGEPGAPACHLVLVTGPLMPRRQRQALHRAVDGLPASLFEFTPDLPSYLAAADLVVSMAGYNTVCELLSLQKRALLIPRARVRAEQRIRALSLAERGLVRCLLPGDLTPASLAAAAADALAAPPPGAAFALEGLERSSAAIAALLQPAEKTRRRAPAAAPQPQILLSTEGIA